MLLTEWLNSSNLIVPTDPLAVLYPHADQAMEVFVRNCVGKQSTTHNINPEKILIPYSQLGIAGLAISWRMIVGLG